MEKIPKIYEKVIERMYEKSFQGKLDSGKARHILGWTFKLRRPEIIPILREMHELKLIEIPKNCGGRYIFILWTPPRQDKENV